MTQRKAATRAINVALLTCSVLLGVAVLEMAARQLHLAPTVLRINPGSDDSAFRYSDNPAIGYEWKPGWRDDDPDLHQSFPSTNSDGFRDVERSREKPAGTKRILLLGDSVAAGVGIREIDDLISRQLERRLGAGYEVLNFGVPGYCTYGEVEQFATRGLAYRPDHVLVLFVENDYVPGNFLFSRYTFEHPPGTEWLFLNSDLFRWASLRWDWFHFGAAARAATQVNAGAAADDNAEQSMALARYGMGRFKEAVGDGQGTMTAALTRLKELSVREGFDVTVALWPRFASTLIFDGDHEMLGDQILAEKVSKDLGFRVIVLSDAFRADFAREYAARGAAANPLEIYTLSVDDPMHPNPRGAAVAAEALARAFGPGGP